MNWFGVLVVLSVAGIAMSSADVLSSKARAAIPNEVRTPQEEDQSGEEDDQDYFAVLNTPTPVAKPAQLGVENGIITDSQITSSSFFGDNTMLKARGSSGGGWIPQAGDKEPWLRIDLGKVKPIHGIGTKGHSSQPIWVTAYTVYISQDGTTFTPLLNKKTGEPRAFMGNSDQDTWKNHCLHLYYGQPPKARFIEFRPLASNGDKFGMRVELYGLIDADDLLVALKKDVWTRSTSGCSCSFNPARFDCACCFEGASQCPINHKHQCYKSDSTDTSDCGKPDVRRIRDPWTLSFTGGLCYFDESKGKTCAQCASGGCQCAMNPNQCVECGHTEACGKKETVFGINSYCDLSPACEAKFATSVSVSL